METIILNQDFEQVDVSDLMSYIDNKELYVFGDSVNNVYIHDCGLKQRIKAILDNNEKKWGTEREKVPIKKPLYVKGAVIITVLADLAHVIPQIRRLGYKEFYFIIKSDILEKYFVKEIEFYKRCNFDYVWNNSDVKFIHVIPDQKFIKPLVYIIENGFSMNEHAFLIYSFNRGNYNDQYDVWHIYEQLYKRYKNISIVDGVFCLDEYSNRRLDVLNEGVLYCQKIIFHGEWFSRYVYEYFVRHMDAVKVKGVLVPWSGRFGYIESNKFVIDNLLRYCNTICIDEKSAYAQKLIKDAGLEAKRYFSNGINYVQPIELPVKKINKIPKVLVSHSCVAYTRVVESLSIISRFVGEIEVYCVGSYGDCEVIEEADRIGTCLFGNSFHMIREYMEYEQYVSFLNDIDIAVYAMEHGAGNTTLQILCYTGTKLFFKPNTNTYNYAKDQGYYVYDYYKIPSMSFEEFIENKTKKRNYEASKKNFDLEAKKEQWGEIFALSIS